MKLLDYEIKPGDKFIKDLTISDSQGHQTLLTYYVIAGIQKGPTLCITSGIHGTEYPGIGANLKLFHDISPAELCGTIIGVPYCNFASFETKTSFVNPLDGKNLNDTFPGSPDGTITEKLCYTLLHQFAEKADYHIDMHSGDSIEYLCPYAFYHVSKYAPDVTEMSRKMALAYGLKYISCTETSGKGATDKGNFYSAVTEMGIPSIQPEIGGIGLITEETKHLHYQGAKNVMILLGMLNQPQPKCDRQSELSRFYRLQSKFNGIYHCFVSPGEKVKKGQRLASITDYHSQQIYTEFFAEEDCVILWVMSTFAACKGDNLMAIGII